MKYVKITARRMQRRMSNHCQITATSNMDKCSSCPGLCCSIAGDVDVEADEIIAIVEHAGCIEKECFDTGKMVIRKGRGLVCPFLGSDNMCSVYDVRPEVCRGYDCEYDKPVKDLRDYLVD